MIDTLLKAWVPLEKLTRAARPPLRADVVYLAYNDYSCLHFEHCAFIPPYPPQQYLAKVELTNRSNQPTYIKRAVLTLNGTREYEWHSSKPIKLDPHEVRKEPIIFPAEKSDTALEEADYVIELVPSVGRRTKVRGRMPIGEKG